ncbi:hypothetical protein BDY17DRAFT_308917 [Neohortaea acidophila]|uniref:Uncharacterized protein n=1 Tax=Neohortaea acidophila TaxID=245834 RepID=A0A6A6Q2B2_9PEZI|nr:uncharacterized protein BDY17DRAFT_308917 [Neohortaea acidophila]KAF2485557.1 hypothetical protein BDY17DRAFT_308917 [Neohortaea acidophila]
MRFHTVILAVVSMVAAASAAPLEQRCYAEHMNPKLMWDTIVPRIQTASELRWSDDATQIPRIQTASELRWSDDATQIPRIQTASELKWNDDATQMPRTQKSVSMEIERDAVRYELDIPAKGKEEVVVAARESAGEEQIFARRIHSL